MISYRSKILLLGLFFFIFGFITWANGALIPYLKIACELEEWQAYFITFAFYISYTVMALPSGSVLQRVGMVRGMQISLGIMAFGCLWFIPAAMERTYPLFLIGLFIVGTGLTMLQTAVNPYITLLGNPETAATRISIMGICNKFAGVIAPIVLGAILLNDADRLMQKIGAMRGQALQEVLDVLAMQVILPYGIMAAVLLGVAFLIRFAHLPEIKPSVNNEDQPGISQNVFRKRLVTGFIAIFCTVGVEVVAGDTIANYGIFHNMSFDHAKILTSYTLGAMMFGYLTGTLTIPRFISQDQAFFVSNVVALTMLVCVILAPGVLSVYLLALLGFANALLWPAIWPQVLTNLSVKQVHQASAVLIMGIAGGAVIPLVYGVNSHIYNNQLAYLTVIPCYLYNIWYWYSGQRERRYYGIKQTST